MSPCGWFVLVAERALNLYLGGGCYILIRQIFCLSRHFYIVHIWEPESSTLVHNNAWGDSLWGATNYQVEEAAVANHSTCLIWADSILTVASSGQTKSLEAKRLKRLSVPPWTSEWTSRAQKCVLRDRAHPSQFLSMLELQYPKAPIIVTKTFNKPCCDSD